MSRYVTDEAVRPEERFALYRLCPCAACNGTGKWIDGFGIVREGQRCSECRGEGRTRDLVATTDSPEGIGTALYTLALEGEWDECPIGILDRMPEPGNPAWLVKPWLPSARNVSDAGRTLRQAQRGRS